MGKIFTLYHPSTYYSTKVKKQRWAKKNSKKKYTYYHLKAFFCFVLFFLLSGNIHEEET